MRVDIRLAVAMLLYVVLVTGSTAVFRLLDHKDESFVDVVYRANSAILGVGGTVDGNASAATLICAIVIQIAGFALRVYVFAAVTAYMVLRGVEAKQGPLARGVDLAVGPQPLQTVQIGTRRYPR